MAVASALRYWQRGYGAGVVLVWLGTIAVGAYASRQTDRTRPPAELIRRAEWRTALLLVIAFAPLYLALLGRIPYQISTDEVTVMMVEAEASAQLGWDIFSVSSYFSFPSFLFIAYGWVGRLLGGIDLASMRAIDATVGLLSIALFYLLMRPLMKRKLALAAAVLLGTSHALLAISRMAMRNNSAVLLELLGLLLLLNGWKQKRVGWTYLGGVVAGLAFYVYEPARMLLILWSLWLLAIALLRRRAETSRRSLRHGAFGLAGFALAAAPLIAGSIRAAQHPEMFDYQREQLLLFPEARLQQQEWVGAASAIEGVRTNLVQGLAAFNSRMHDNGYVYYNPGHGFVDPLTGILLWVGVLWTASRLSAHKPEDSLLLLGFLVPWLTFSLVTSKAPNYTRMLIMLPFVAALTLRGIEFTAVRLQRLSARRWPGSARLLSGDRIALGTVAVIAVWNLGIYADYVITGLVERESVGSLNRYIEARRIDDEHSFYVAADLEHSFFGAGEAWHWEELVRFFAGEDAWVQAVPPEFTAADGPEAPFSLFMTREVWESNAGCLTARYPNRKVHELTSDGWHLAIEVLPSEDLIELPGELCQ